MGTYRFIDIIGKEFGSEIMPFDTVTSSGGFLLRPSPELVTLALTHRTQILYHADIMTTIQLLGLSPGKKVIEAGTGSGSMTTSLARAVGATGRVYTCEFHHERHLKAKEEFKIYEIDHIVSAFHRDVIGTGFPEEATEVDAIFLDLPAPWSCIGYVNKHLKCGGKVVCFSPCIEQVARNCEALDALNFHDVMTIEVLSKPWHVRFTTKEGEETKDLPAVDEVMSVTLPMRGHTAYLTVAVKAAKNEAEQIA